MRILVNRSAPKIARVSRPAPRSIVQMMLRVSFAFLRGDVSFLGFAGFAAFAAAFFALRSARQARNFAFSLPSGPLGSSGSVG